MNFVPRLRKCESAETMLELIETDYIVEENKRSLIFKLLEEIVELKQNGVPSSITAKWNELDKVLESLQPTVS